MRSGTMVRAIYRDNTFHLIDSVNLENGDEVEIAIIPDSQVKKLIGVFQIDDIETINEIVESDLFEWSEVYPNGTKVIIDTNIILYTALAHPYYQKSSTDFLLRIEREEIKGFIPSIVVQEVA